MKKRKPFKQLLTISLAFTLLFSTASTAYADTNTNPNPNSNPVTSIFLDYLKDAVWKLIKAGSNKLIDVPGKTEYAEGWVRKSTGGINFNSEENGASIQIPVNLGKSNLNMDAFPYIDPLHWNEKLSFILTSPENTDVISKTLTHNQHAFYDSASPYGEYTARFIEDSQLTWNCYVTLTDWDVGARAITDNDYLIKPTTDQVYLIPSNEHLAPAKAPNSNSTPILNTNQLLNQFFDNNIDNYVTSLKDYNIGDIVHFSDTIKNIEYDSNNDCTYISFDSSTGTVSWPFQGNLTNRFNTNDTISLEFSVVEDFSNQNITFENINYFVDGYAALQQNSYLSIDDYLAK